MRGNRIRATAEAVDINEGSTGGRAAGDVSGGSTPSGRHDDSWIDDAFRRDTAHLDGGRGVAIKPTPTPNRVTCDSKVAGGRSTNGSCS